MKKELQKPVEFKGAHEMPYCTVSVSDMTWNRTGSWRYLRPSYIEQIPACQASCPAAEPIERWLFCLEKGDARKAREILTIENPFPGIMGRVCFHPCEVGCNRKDVGGAVTINMLERFLADEAGYEGAKMVPWKKTSGKKAAIIGSGPAGLACAYFLARLGHAVTIFEKYPKPGGLLRYGIPEYRLPKDILDKELKKLYDLGINFQCGKALNKSEIEGLAKKHDAVFVAAGAHLSRPLGAEGEKAEGIVPALEFLENVQLETDNGETDLRTYALTRLRTVVVVGGGNSAIDAARTALRLGAKSVQIIYRRSRVEMPAFSSEVEDAEKDGVVFEMLAAPSRVITEGGRVKALECVKMKLGPPDASGRRAPVKVAGSEFTVPADLVLTAIGEVADENILPAKSPKIFFGGDMIAQPRTVVNAIGSGKYSAIEIDCMLIDKNYKEVFEHIHIPETNFVKMADYLNANVQDRQRTVVRTEHLNTYYFDRSEPVKDATKAREQTSRCMHCGRCTQCDNCFIYCPDVSILKKKDGYDIAYDFCKGCGVCVKECPRAAMKMSEESYGA